MCDPVSITMGTLAVASAASGYQQAKVQQETQEKMYTANRNSALASMRDSYTSNQLRQQQESAAAAQEIQKTRREAMEQMGTARVAAGEAGITGISVDALLQEIGADAGQDVSTIEQNRDWSLTQINQQQRGVLSQTQGRINSVSTGQSVSALPYLIQAGSGVAGAYGNYKTQ